MSKQRKNKTRTRLDGYLDILGLGIAIATLLGFLGRLHWMFDLFSHFRVQYMQLCLVLIGIALWRRQNKRAGALILLACLNYAFVLPLYFGNPAPPNGSTVRAMLMNLNAGNGNTEQVLEAIHNAAPDILLLEEVTPKWAHELSMLNTTYPHRIAEPQEGCFGIMLLSKYPLARERVVEIGSAGVPSILADIHFPQGTVSVIGTHPLPPVGAEYSTHRNNQLAALPEFVHEQKHPVLLIGDLNASPFSYWFRRVVSESGLKNSMKGFGFQPSWPSNNRFLRIPLDHVLHSPEIIIHNRGVGGNVGSDHFPVIVDFSINPEPRATL
ncbi:MAG: endonuclease/exonuclease/phosphatase family protein [Verrucomicrobia bacterium]|nr:endonuclease/exonuclease/phosphatase family protein [Verrucomicrobiota bacterium]